jgi:hypothetical protein
LYKVLFNAVAFNANIGGWAVSAVANMASAFEGASAFNTNLAGEHVSITLLFSRNYV